MQLITLQRRTPTAPGQSRLLPDLTALQNLTSGLVAGQRARVATNLTAAQIGAGQTAAAQDYQLLPQAGGGLTALLSDDPASGTTACAWVASPQYAALDPTTGTLPLTSLPAGNIDGFTTSDGVNLTATPSFWDTFVGQQGYTKGSSTSSGGTSSGGTGSGGTSSGGSSGTGSSGGGSTTTTKEQLLRIVYASQTYSTSPVQMGAPNNSLNFSVVNFADGSALGNQVVNLRSYPAGSGVFFQGNGSKTASASPPQGLGGMDTNGNYVVYLTGTKADGTNYTGDDITITRS